MKLLPKTALVVAVAVTVGLAVILTIAGTVLRGDVERQQESAAHHDGQRVADLMADDLADLEWTARELTDITHVLFFAGNGSDASGADLDPNQTQAVFQSVFLGGGVDGAYFRSNDIDWFGVGFDVQDPALFVDPPEALNRSLQHSTLMQQRSVGAAASAVLRAGDTVHLVASYPLFSPDGASMLAVSRTIDDAYLADLADRAHEEVQVCPWLACFDARHDVWGVAADGVHVTSHGATHTVAFRLDGADGEPVALAHFHQPSSLIQESDRSMAFFIGTSLIVSGLLLGVALWILRVTVTGRVDRLSRGMRRIARGNHLDERADETGDDEVSRLAGSFNHLMDSLERKTRRLEQSNQDLEGFAHVVSHDLKAPLSTFNLNLHLLAKQAAASGDPDARTRVQRMRSQVRSMEERIDAILAYSRHQSSALDRRPIAGDTLVQRVLGDLESVIEETGARIQVDPLPELHGDPNQLAQVLQNLLSNAIKFHRPERPPTIHVHAVRRPRGWMIHVDDDGVGFHDDDRPTMFRAFGRLDETADRDGHGIGLATCARIMDLHGGRLMARGRPGRGARFTMCLPVDDARPNRPPRPRRARARPRFSAPQA